MLMIVTTTTLMFALIQMEIAVMTVRQVLLIQPMMEWTLMQTVPVMMVIPMMTMMVH